MSSDAQAKSPDAAVAKRIPSYMLPKKKYSPKRPTPRPTVEKDIKSKAVKRNARIVSTATHTSMVSTSSSVTTVDSAQIKSKIEVMQSIVSRPVYISSDADDLQSSVSLEDDVSEEKRMVAASTKVSQRVVRPNLR